MLVLTRKVGETLRIGDNVEVVIGKVVGGRVQLGIIAPLDVRVVRGELPKLPIQSPDEQHPQHKAA